MRVQKCPGLGEHIRKIFKIFLFLLIFKYLGVLPVCMCAHHIGNILECKADPFNLHKDIVRR